MPLYQLRIKEKAKRRYQAFSNNLKGQVIEALEDIENEGLEVVAEELERELKGRWKYKFDSWRIILMQTDDAIIVLDIRRRDSDTYKNMD
ncbi:hypothetical protein KFU94_53795 [Chloroflexi bacterium TSY]|nr:hypothetical protein [Chloroflexi bacterium TSY]